MQFYFNLAGSIIDPDDNGLDLPSDSDARIMAVTLAGEMLRDRPELVWFGEEFRVEVTNGDRELLFTIITLGVEAAPVSSLQ